MIIKKTLMNVSELNFPFTMLGGLGIHRAILEIDTNQTTEEPTFVITYPDETTETLIVGGAHDNTYHTMLSESSGVYTLDIRVNPDALPTVGNPNNYGVAVDSLLFTLRDTRDSSLGQVDITIETFNAWGDVVIDGGDLSTIINEIGLTEIEERVSVLEDNQDQIDLLTAWMASETAGIGDTIITENDDTRISESGDIRITQY